MSNPPVLEPEATASSSPKSVTTPSPDQPGLPEFMNLIVGLSALGLVISFFFPWLKILGIPMSGFEMQKISESYLLVWIQPVTAGIALIPLFIGRRDKLVELVAGVTPLFMLLFLIYSDGFKVTELLENGGYAALILGGLLVIIPNNRKP